MKIVRLTEERDTPQRMRVLLLANTDWYLYNFRFSLAKAIRDEGHEVVLASPPGKYASRFQQEGFRWVGVPIRRFSANPVRELATIVKIFLLYRREKPDLVHHFTIKCVVYGSLVARLLGIRGIVNSITGLGYVFSGEDWRARLLRTPIVTLYRRILGRTQVIFQNAEDREFFLKLGIASSENCHLVRGSGVDIERFRSSPQPEGIPVVILASRLLWDKGVGEFVQAAVLVKGQGMPARFVLVGTPDPENPNSVPETQLKLWADQGIVEWWGMRENMPSVIEQSSVVCLPSAYGEGVPKILIEAAACGRPVVASDAPGCRDIVHHGVNGLLVPPRDAPAVAEAVLRLLTDPDLRKEMGERGVQIARDSFSVQQVIRETLRIYETVTTKESRLKENTERV